MRKLMKRMHLSTKLYQLSIRIEVKHKSEKAQLKLIIKIVDYMIQKFDLEKELLEMFD